MDHVKAQSLTKNQGLVLDALMKAVSPLTAYELLDNLRDQGLKAPPQVYRALDRLTDLGVVHRLESLNAFVACRHPQCQNRSAVVFAICDKCQKADELGNAPLSAAVRETCEKTNFKPTRAIVEIRGTCARCLS